MSNLLRPPSLGPIVGHTTDSSVRIWIRGADVGDSRTVGIAALYEKNKYVTGSAQYFRLHREYDRTGIADFEKLKPDSNYTVRTASFTLDSTDMDIHVSDDDIEERLPKADVWLNDLKQLPEPESVANFRTFPAQAGDAMSFIFGSCRYPGILWKKKRADVIFDPIYERFQKGTGGKQPRFMIMVGDQIYADMFNKSIPIGLADTEEEFRDRYITAFGSRNMRRLLRSVPHYMILDDHEIEDNWVRGRIKKREKRMLFTIAISAYMSYQWCHCPRNFAKRLYYSFECSGYPFFVTDGRTQRIRDDDDKVLEDNHMLGYPLKDKNNPNYKGQIDILCEWLVEQQKSVGNRPKFIVSASVFVPNNVDTIVKKRKGKTIDNRWKDDSWAAFPETRKQLLKTIVEKNVQNVVFLSGDIHCSNVAEMSFENKQKEKLPLKAFSITSSAFYWPFPFADGEPNDYVHDSKKEDDGFDINGDVTLHYKARDFEQDDNFIQVNIGPTTIMAETFNKKGESIKKSNLKLA